MNPLILTATLLLATTSAPVATTTPPNPFPLVESPATTSSTTILEEVPDVVTSTPEPAPQDPPLAPVTPIKKEPAPAPVKKVEIRPATTTATSSPTVVSSMNTTPLSGSVYIYAREMPLTTDATQGMLGVAGASALIGFILLQRRLLERSVSGVSTLFNRSLPRPHAERR